MAKSNLTRDLLEVIKGTKQITEVQELKVIKGTKQIQELELDFSSQKMKNIPEELLQKIYGVEILTKINFSNNSIQELPEQLFLKNTIIDQVNFSSNQIQKFPSQLLNEKNGQNTVILNFSDNKITSLDLDALLKLPKSTIVDFRDNVQICDTFMLFNNFFRIACSYEITDDLFTNFKFLNRRRGDIETDKQIARGTGFGFILRNANDNNTLRNRLFSLFLNKSVYQCEKAVTDFIEKFKKLNDYEYSLLDFFISLDDFDSFYIVQIKIYIETIAKHKKTENVEFKLRSTESLCVICERNDLFLFEALFFFEINEIEKMKINEDSINEFIESDDFYLQIDFTKCLRFCIENNNQQLAINLFKVFLYIKRKRDCDKLFENDSERSNKIESLNQKLNQLNNDILHLFLYKWFEDLEWFDLIEFILDNAGEKDEYLCLSQTSFVFECKCKWEATTSQTNKDILILIKESGNDIFLRHVKTQALLSDKWKKIPRFIYYSKLIIYLVFIVLFSRNKYDIAEIWTCVFIIFIFIAIEICELIEIKILYIFSYKNIIESISYTLSLAYLVIRIFDVGNDWKSTLYSSSIFLSYCVLIFHLDKCAIIGRYLYVFGNILKKSFKFFLVLLILMLGFLFSFRNRIIDEISDQIHNESNQTFNRIENFNASFSMSSFKLFTMLVGNLETEDMGIENLDLNNMINFLIYGCFIFLMPILFINIFTGISIDEVKTMIEESEAKNIAKKIEFVNKINKLWETDNCVKIIIFKIIVFPIANFFNYLCNYLFSKLVNYLIGKIFQKVKKHFKDKKNKIVKQKNKERKIMKKDGDSLLEIRKNINQINDIIQNKFLNVDKRLSTLEKNAL